MKRTIISIAISCILLTGLGATVLANNEKIDLQQTNSMPSSCLQTTVYPPEGGEWKYGVNIFNVYSLYTHPNRGHHTSVQGAYGNWNYSIWVAGGYLARSAIDPDFNRQTNHAYYDVRDN